MKSYKLKLIIILCMLFLGFIGLIVTDVNKGGAWNYWRCLAALYALLSLCMSWHFRKQGWKQTALTIWHEAAHWAGLIAGICIASYLVNVGLIGRFEASLLALVLLALTTYLAGIYIEPSFILLGIALGGFALGIAFVDEYLYNIVLPLTLIAGVAIFYIIHKTHKKFQQ